MKQWLKVLTLSTSVVLFSHPAVSQEYPGCFMRDGNYDLIFLSSICDNEVSTNPSVANPNVFRIPIKRRQGGTPVVDVMFNGKHTFEMLFDTGATATVLSEAAAKTLELEAIAEAQFSTASEKAVSMPVGVVESVSVGGVNLQDMPVAVSSALDLGLLGQDVFGEYKVVIDQDFIELHKKTN